MGFVSFYWFFCNVGGYFESCRGSCYSVCIFENRHCVEDVEKSDGQIGHVHGADVSRAELIKHRVNAHVRRTMDFGFWIFIVFVV